MTLTGFYEDSVGNGTPVELPAGRTSLNSSHENITLVDPSASIPTITFYKNAEGGWDTKTYAAGFLCCYLDESLYNNLSNTKYGEGVGDGTGMPEGAVDQLYVYVRRATGGSEWVMRKWNAADDDGWSTLGANYIASQSSFATDYDDPVVQISTNMSFIKSSYGADADGIWEKDGSKYHVVVLRFTPQKAGETIIAIRGLELKHGGLATKYYFVNLKVVDEQQSASSVTEIDAPTAKTGLVYSGTAQAGVPAGTGYTLEGAIETDAGDYTATAKLDDGYAWADGSTDDKTIPWSISKATLSATYCDERVRPDETPSYSVQVTGWKGEDNADTATGYTAPTVTPLENLGVNTTHTLTPSGGVAKNYEFTYWPGTLTVLKYGASLTAGDNVGSLATDLKAGGEPVSVDVAYTGRNDASVSDATITGWTRQGSTSNIISYDYSGILEASYDSSTGKLTVTPLAEGSCMLQVRVAGSDSYDDAASDRISVKIDAADKADATLTFENGYEAKFEGLKAGGDAVQVSLVYAGKENAAASDVSVEPASSEVADVAYDVAAGTLTITPKAAGTEAFTVSVEGGDAYNTASQEVSVTVAEADAAEPTPIKADAEYELTVGGAGKDISYESELDYSVDKSGIVQVTKSADGKTLTVDPVAAGVAVVTVSAPGTTLDPVAVKFTVKAAEDEGDSDGPAEKGTVALDPITLAAGDSQSGNIAIKDADGNTVSSGITASSSDSSVATASYENGKLTVTGVAAGTATVTLSSDALDDDYTIAVTVTAADPAGDSGDSGSSDNGDAGNSNTDSTGSDQTVTFTDASGDGVKADYSGLNVSGAAANAKITLVVNGVAQGTDSFTKLQSVAEGQLLAVYNATLKVDGVEVHSDFGTISLSFPVPTSYEGKEVVVWHLHSDGTTTSQAVTVKDGLATVTVTDLSDFAVESGKSSTASTTTSNGTATSSSTDASKASNLSKTGDGSMTAVWIALVVIGFGCVGGYVLLRRKDDLAGDDRSGEDAV